MPSKLFYLPGRGMAYSMTKEQVNEYFFIYMLQLYEWDEMELYEMVVFHFQVGSLSTFGTWNALFHK